MRDIGYERCFCSLNLAGFTLFSAFWRILRLFFLFLEKTGFTSQLRKRKKSGNWEVKTKHREKLEKKNSKSPGNLFIKTIIFLHLHRVDTTIDSTHTIIIDIILMKIIVTGNVPTTNIPDMVTIMISIVIEIHSTIIIITIIIIIDHHTTMTIVIVIQITIDMVAIMMIAIKITINMEIIITIMMIEIVTNITRIVTHMMIEVNIQTRIMSDLD